MSDDFNDEPQPTEDNPNIRQLRKKAEERDQFEDKLSVIQKENAILRSGLTGLTDRQISALSREHEGELTKDAILSTATELGFYKPEPEAPKVPDEDRQTMERIADAQTGAPNGTTSAVEEALSARSEADFWAAAAKTNYIVLDQ